MLNMCTSFMKTPLVFNVIQGTRFSYKSGHNCQFKITKGHNSMRNVGADMFFSFLCTPFDDGLYTNRNL